MISDEIRTRLGVTADDLDAATRFADGYELTEPSSVDKRATMIDAMQLGFAIERNRLREIAQANIDDLDGTVTWLDQLPERCAILRETIFEPRALKKIIDKRGRA